MTLDTTVLKVRIHPVPPLCQRVVFVLLEGIALKARQPPLLAQLEPTTMPLEELIRLTALNARLDTTVLVLPIPSRQMSVPLDTTVKADPTLRPRMQLTPGTTLLLELHFNPAVLLGHTLKLLPIQNVQIVLRDSTVLGQQLQPGLTAQ